MGLFLGELLAKASDDKEDDEMSPEVVSVPNCYLAMIEFTVAFAHAPASARQPLLQRASALSERPDRWREGYFLDLLERSQFTTR
jgi:hypothetical protein